MLIRLLMSAALLAALAATTSAQSPQSLSAEPPIRYGRDIRPLLSDRCFLCHGPDQHKRAADLRLDLREHAVAAREHGAAIVPGDPGASLLLQQLRHTDPDQRMPPASSNKQPLDEHEIALLERWIAAGAPYEEHWSFVPPTAPAVPNTAAHPVDAFLLDAMRGHGVEPTAAADASTLCRRVYLVLTGLPPTPAERAAFLADTSPDAYRRLVDRLLQDEPYATRHAEHLASIWLDAGRYADTSGIHMDAGRQAYLWRDRLIEALRSDQPFDEFLVEQLAGDLLPDPTPEQLVATGFLRNHITTDEGGAINAEYLVEYAAERTETVGSVFLGLTVGCARCHDHKYDPFTQQDYYRLFSFFYNNDEPGLYGQSRDAFRALEPNLQVPTEAQQQRFDTLDQQIVAARAALQQQDPAERAAFDTWRRESIATLGLQWTRPEVQRASSRGGAKLTVLDDNSVLGSGDNPDFDRQVYTLTSHAPAQRLLCLEGLPDASLPGGRTSRAAHGNVVLSGIVLEVRPLGSDAPFAPVPLVYAMADVEQQNGDFCVANALVDDASGWAPAGHQAEGQRTAWFLAASPFGSADGTELRVTLAYESRYPQHVFGRVRFSTSALAADGLALLPAWTSGYHVCGPFETGEAVDLYDTAFGPERVTAIEPGARFDEKPWRYDDKLRRGERNTLRPSRRNAQFVAQRIWLPQARRVSIGIGSDDGFMLFVDGEPAGEHRINRPVGLDQDTVEVDLDAGLHLLVLKVINTAGAGGFALRVQPADGQLAGGLHLLLHPDSLTDDDAPPQLLATWRTDHSQSYRTRTAQLEKLERDRKQLEKDVPMAMVMRERETPRATYVLTRGEYDKPDKQRPVDRELPALFGGLPTDLPRNRLGLARWLVSDRNPLTRRVVVNRLWEFVFGVGIVRTSEDFGRQGEWPSHPELIDWLACEFAANGYSVRHMLRLLVTSDAFRRQGAVGPGAATDPGNRLLSWFPRRRLTAEAIRDQALYAAGLLVERRGGPSVKPYQPPGLWREVAMPQSNTRTFERDDGDALWRRSLYTYWKRACPPPSLLTFDAPTREFCTIRRSRTNTPLQALVLWNDEQYVEAARELAGRAMRAHADDRERIVAMFELATARSMTPTQLELALTMLREQQTRYRADPDAARGLLQVGAKPATSEFAAPDLAAMALLASAFLDLDATLYID